MHSSVLRVRPLKTGILAVCLISISTPALLAKNSCNNGVCAPTAVEHRVSAPAKVGTRMAMQQRDGRLVLGVEHDGNFQSVSVLGRR